MINKIKRHIGFLMLTLLLLVGGAGEAWGATKTIKYHILTLPMSSTIPGNTKAEYYGWRMEALRVIATTDGNILPPLPANFQSPLAKNFKYYANASVDKESNNARSIYENHSQNKYYLYRIKGEETPEDDSDDATPMTPGVSEITGSCDIYVVYEYDATNTIAKLDGSESYNIVINGGFLAYNIGRNNRLSVIPAKYNNEYLVTGEQLCSTDFVYINLSGKGTGITTWWNGNVTSPRSSVDSYFHFLFKYTGCDPYNITIGTAYTGDRYYGEKYNKESTELKKYYKGATVFSTAKLQNDNLLLSSADNKRYTTPYSSSDPIAYEDAPGYYNDVGGHVWNSFAILNNSNGNGYVYVGTRCVNGSGNIGDPTDNKYYYLKAENNALMYSLMTIEAATEQYSTDTVMYEVRTYTFNVKTPFGNTITAQKKWPEAYSDTAILASHVPDTLLRKYCGIVGFYKDAALTQQITKYNQAEDDNIYIKYQVTGMPFNAISPSADYSTATWYELTDAGSTQASGKKIKYDGTNTVFKNNGGNASYDKLSEFAFVGDPYELRVLYRDATESNSAKRYVGAATVSAGNALTFSDTEGTGFKWEIPYDETDGSFVLRQYGSVASPFYWKWDATSSGNTININTDSTRVKVMALPTFTYIYNIVDLAGNIAIKGTAEQTIFSNLTGYSSIPASIRSPFLADERITFYDSYTDRNGDTKINRLDWHNDTGGASKQDSILQTPGTNNANIYVAYTTSHLSAKNIKLIYNQEFNVKLNGEYLYWNSSDNKVHSESLSGSDEKLATTPYLWHLRGRDPYAMRVDNRGYTENQSLGKINIDVYYAVGDGTFYEEEVNNGEFIRVDGGTWGDDKALTWTSTRDNASRFVTMMSNSIGVYEVMAATGTTDYYHIGRASTAGAEPKIYSAATYPHGSDQLRFELASNVLVSYHLIDKSGAEIFKDEISSKNPRLALPADYVSPLVEEYYYYQTLAKATTNLPEDRISEIEEDDDNHVYVTYKTSDAIGFGTNYPLMLKFHNGSSYHMEDGSDNLTTGAKIKAVYPYCNGDGNLNIYGSAMNEEQMAGGTNTRPRWVWYLESDNNDPYHVKIHSKSTISFNGAPNSTYLQTYAVHFDQETDAPNKQRVVTGVNFPGISGKAATEYAVLGRTGYYKLLTIDKIAADLNGDGDKTDDGENERRAVTSFEQYWKTYNMVRRCVLGDARVDKNDPTAFNDPIIMPAERWTELKTKLTARGVDDEANRVDGCSWHSYEAIANATRWNGYSDLEGSDGYEKKKVERLQHWFQTFDMGDGTFDIENAHIPSVLVLLDRHGWEIMRKPIPTGDGDAEKSAKEAVLRAYDSPMVKEYKFYSNATKASGCHRFELRMSGKVERDPIKVNGKQFTSTSLATLPSYVADRDLYVTYTVKEEYDKSYNPSTSTASTFIVLQNHNYASDDNSGTTIDVTPAPSPISDEIIADAGKVEGSKTFKQNALWYVRPNRNIDIEMGNPGTAITYPDSANGFDPYNIQLKNAYTNKFFTIGMTKSILDGGQYNGDYTDGSTNVTLADSTTSPISSPESYDHSTLKMTNQTFMAVSDAKGNMQFMPRFDHSHRINAFATLADPSSHVKAEVDDATPGEQTSFIIRPVVHEYRIIDNQGNVALHYHTGGESYPSMPEHFKSPLAKNFKYYKTLEDSNDDGVYELATLANEITSSFGAAGVTYDADHSASIYIRYEYDKSSDTEHDDILQGKWLTMSLGNNAGNPQWTYYNGTINTEGAGLYTGTKPATTPTDNLKDAKQWHWKFLASPMVSTSERYKAPDPYAVEIYNRDANKAEADMGTNVSVDGVNRFVILSHPDGDYALAKASDDINTYSFLNGDAITAHDAGTPKSAKIVADENFSATNEDISDDARVIFSNDISHTYAYYVITNAKYLAATAEQSEDDAITNSYEPLIPGTIQTPLLNWEDFIYYGTASVLEGKYILDSESELQSVLGLYDDVVYVRYPEFERDSTPYLVPNKKGTSDGHVIRHNESNDVAIDITGKMPYNIIWYNDNMMQSTDNSAISDGGSHDLSGVSQYVWYFEGSDPYDIKIKKTTDKYVDGTGTLNATAKSFMLLPKEDYDYGVFAETGNQTNMLNFAGSPHTMSLTTSDPNKFIIFALSTHQLIYHLVIDSTNNIIRIPYREGTEDDVTPQALTELEIKGTSQRDLKSVNTGTGIHVAGEKYQLGHTYMGQTYCFDAGQVSIGDKLEVPRELERANCNYFFYIDNIQTQAATPSVYQETAANVSAVESAAENLSVDGLYYYYNVGSGTAYYRAHKESSGAFVDTCTADDYNHAWQDNESLNNRYKGLKVDNLMSNSELIGSVVKVNVTYAFNTGLETNAGDGFVTDINHLWYTFETKDGPYLAHYTNAWGLQAMEGRATRYTNDYLWSPLGDVYGFKMYNRYVYKTSNETTRVMTTEDFSEGRTLKMAVPGSTITNEELVTVTATAGNEVYELLATETTTPGYFLIHPVINNSGTQYYVRRNTESGPRLNYAILSTTPTEWTYGLTEELVQPYYDRAGYVGGLTPEGKAAYDTTHNLMQKQAVVYDDENIIQYKPGYYRLHNQPDVSGLTTPRYASGYLHDIEKTAGTSDTPIPMHFYSRKGVNTTFEGEGGLTTGFTETPATRGAIPVPATEYDPSTIFYFSGPEVDAPTLPTSTMSTQGLYVKGDQTNDNQGDAVMTANSGEATTFTIMDIGGAVFLIHDGSVPASRKYFHFSQSYEVSSVNMIYDLKYFHNSPTDDAKWCLEPANNQGLMVEMHDGGDGYFYSTFCAPFDVAMPREDGSNNYYAYVCDAWDTDVIHPKRVPADGVYLEGKFVPAGTPVIMRTTDNTGSIKLTIPTNEPTTPAVSCIFSGAYLEQLLATEVTSASNMVYAFGLPITGYTGVTTTSGSTNGEIEGVLGGVQADRGVGFYINATPNKENHEEKGQWTPNNRYVQHNKIYYRAGSSGAHAPEHKSDVEFIPVIFDDENEEEPGENNQGRVGDGCAYDILGRKVASEAEVKDGSWRQRLAPGIYIVGGEKIYLGY